MLGTSITSVLSTRSQGQRVGRRGGGVEGCRERVCASGGILGGFKVTLATGRSASRASAPSIAPERHRPVERPRAPPRSMPCHRRWVQAGSGRDSTMFLSCGITAGDGSHRVPLTAESVRKQGRTKKRTLPSRPVRPPWRPEDAQTVRARACGSGLTTLVDVKIRRHRRHARA